MGAPAKLVVRLTPQGAFALGFTTALVTLVAAYRANRAVIIERAVFETRRAVRTQVGSAADLPIVEPVYGILRTTLQRQLP